MTKDMDFGILVKSCLNELSPEPHLDPAGNLQRHFGVKAHGNPESLTKTPRGS